MRPETIPINIYEIPEENGIKGYRTSTKRVTPMQVTYFETRQGNYSFMTWKAGIGPIFLTLDNPIKSDKEASMFAESKLRKMIQEDVQ